MNRSRPNLPELQYSLLALLMSILAVLLPTTALALPDDRRQHISIESDYAERNDQTGQTVYRGNVVISQGSVLIEAEQIILHFENSKVVRIECDGKPASYQQTPEINAPVMIARADHIDYLPADNSIALKSKAMLSRDGTIIRGDSIDYDIDKQTWKAKGSDLGEQKRIQLVIPPPALQTDSETPTEETTL